MKKEYGETLAHQVSCTLILDSHHLHGFLKKLFYLKHKKPKHIIKIKYMQIKIDHQHFKDKIKIHLFKPTANYQNICKCVTINTNDN